VNLSYGGGYVMRKPTVSYAIFWLPPTLQDGSPTHMSPTYQSLIERYFGDVGGNGLYRNNTQYYQVEYGKEQHIRNRSSLGAAWVDTSPYPASGCQDPATPGNCLTDAQLQAEVVRAMQVNGWKGGLAHEFYVLTSYGEGSCFDSSSTGCAFTYYCAYHGAFFAGDPIKRVIYANQPYATPAYGCITPTTPNDDYDADGTINLISHEQMESVTDPTGRGWTAPDGEIGDKCVWRFGPLPYDHGKANEKWNGHFYVVQMEWSNASNGCVQQYP